MSHACDKPILISLNVINKVNSSLKTKTEMLQVLITTRKEYLNEFKNCKVNFLIMGTRIGFKNHRLIKKTEE